MGLPAVRETAAAPFAGTPYENSPQGPWTPYGGALDVTSGVVHIPRSGALDPDDRPLRHRRGRGGHSARGPVRRHGQALPDPTPGRARQKKEIEQ